VFNYLVSIEEQHAKNAQRTVMCLMSDNLPKDIKSLFTHQLKVR